MGQWLPQLFPGWAEVLPSAPAEKVRVELLGWTGWKRTNSAAGWRYSVESQGQLGSPCPTSPIPSPAALSPCSPALPQALPSLQLLVAHMTKARHKPSSLCPVLLCGPEVALGSGPGTVGGPFLCCLHLGMSQQVKKAWQDTYPFYLTDTQSPSSPLLWVLKDHRLKTIAPGKWILVYWLVFVST